MKKVTAMVSVVVVLFLTAILPQTKPVMVFQEHPLIVGEYVQQLRMSFSAEIAENKALYVYNQGEVVEVIQAGEVVVVTHITNLKFIDLYAQRWVYITTVDGQPIGWALQDDIFPED